MSTTPDPEPGSISRRPDDQVITARTLASNIDTLLSTSGGVMKQQLASPPDSTNSTSSPSPTPSLDVAQQPISLSSIGSTPTQRGVFLIHHNSDTAVSDLRREQVNGRGCLTPGRRRSSSSFSVTSCRLTMSESSISQMTLSEAGKRKAPDSPCQRLRVLTQARERPLSMTLPLRQQQPHQPTSEISQSSDLSEQHQSVVRSPTMKSQRSDYSEFWGEDPAEPDPQSCKRPKADLRGVEGRKARHANWDRPQTVLHRSSTNSMIANLSLGPNNLDKDISQSGQEACEVGPLNGDTVMVDTENVGREQVLVVEKSRVPKRRPLMEISVSVDVVDDTLVSLT